VGNLGTLPTIDAVAQQITLGLMVQNVEDVHQRSRSGMAVLALPVQRILIMMLDPRHVQLVRKDLHMFQLTVNVRYCDQNGVYFSI